MQTAQQRNGVLDGRFFFRKLVTGCDTYLPPGSPACSFGACDEDAFELMTVDQIINGKVCPQVKRVCCPLFVFNTTYAPLMRP